MERIIKKGRKRSVPVLRGGGSPTKESVENSHFRNGERPVRHLREEHTTVSNAKGSVGNNSLILSTTNYVLANSNPGGQSGVLPATETCGHLV